MVLTVVVVMEIAMRRDRAVFIYTATQCNTVARVSGDVLNHYQGLVALHTQQWFRNIS